MNDDPNEPPNKLTFHDPNLAKALFGEREKHLKLIESEVGLKIHTRGSTVNLDGDPIEVGLARRILVELYDLLKDGYPLYPQDVDYAIRIIMSGEKVSLKEIFLDTVFIAANKSVITPKSLTQKRYTEAIRKQDIVFGIGPAGTGKTYLAMAMAVAELNAGSIHRIILARPAVEAGEKLGFLPGDLYEKVNPYLRPLYDALHDMMKFEQASRLISKGVIEVAPLAFMRGRTLNDCFVILDEAQNTTSEQMKMFLTRLGFTSKAVITGDVTQTDLPEGKVSGLIEACQILSDVEGISFIYFSEKDVVRHRLVREIIKSYDKFETSSQ
ncbi:MAG: PhoH family protein [Deltaproteobacteria bacterium]|nr:PhoH family protein [Deltaproteobacteria bacterium]MBW2050954.1 PhoH family protein [Deltaproteobacteria bacterium]MBW2139625.1 PhoH family protein [Deltaproteobacteria bacterium]MBW2322263.1 PhoH family protein [Deltaproteobacteria bacterium]